MPVNDNDAWIRKWQKKTKVPAKNQHSTIFIMIRVLQMCIQRNAVSNGKYIAIKKESDTNLCINHTLNVSNISFALLKLYCIFFAFYYIFERLFVTLNTSNNNNISSIDSS